MNALYALVICLLLSACSTSLPIHHDYSARGQSSRVQYIVLHYTVGDFSHSLKLLTQGEVSAHYLIGRDAGQIYQLVDDSRRAWHAGDSSWRGRTWLNASTLGIELVNQGYTEQNGVRHWQPYSDEQIAQLIALLKELLRRHQLPIDSIIGHSDIAFARKSDPGPLFPWHKLAEAGLIRWPDAAQVQRYQNQFSSELPGPEWVQQKLQQIGYGLALSGQFDTSTAQALAAFQMKYRPERYDGQLDVQSAALLAAVADLARN